MDYRNKINGIALEPSAGSGNMIKQLSIKGFSNIHYCELMPENNEILESEIKRLEIPAIKIGDNFSKIKFEKSYYDFILTNPPFRHEHKHLNIMFDTLKSGGYLFGIFSPKNYDSDDFARYVAGKCCRWAMYQLETSDTDKEFDKCTVLVCEKS